MWRTGNYVYRIILPSSSGCIPRRWPLAAGRWPLAAGRWPLAAGRFRTTYSSLKIEGKTSSETSVLYLQGTTSQTTVIYVTDIFIAYITNGNDTRNIIITALS
jgi:hypothetical protein